MLSKPNMFARTCRRMVLSVSLLGIWLMNPALAFAHADIIVRITALDQQLQKTPEAAGLYLKRGELHRLHRDRPAALADYDCAAWLEPGNPVVLFYRGRLWLEAGYAAKARPLLDRFIAVRPDHANALLVRSRTLAGLGEWLAAADDLSRAITLLDPPTPEIYLERARALVAAGPEHTDLALHGLDDGVTRLGPLVTLIQYAIEVERASGRHRQALRRFNILPDQISRQPAWSAVRGDILHDMGDIQQSQATYRAGLATIKAYPSARRNARATVELESRLRALID